MLIPTYKKKDAEKSISLCADGINEARNEGGDVSLAEKTVRLAEAALREGDFKKAVQLADDGSEQALRILDRTRALLIRLDQLELIMMEKKAQGRDVSPSERAISEARASLSRDTAQTMKRITDAAYHLLSDEETAKQ